MSDELDDFLAHYGIPGMKWGKRKANPNYSSQQQKRDQQIYGNRGVKRINKALNKGDPISTARGAEKTRRDAVMGRNKYFRQGGKVAGTVAGGVLGNVALSAAKKTMNTQAARVAVARVIGAEGSMILTNVLNMPQARLAVTMGGLAVGNMLSGDIAVSANMRAHGYNPKRK